MRAASYAKKLSVSTRMCDDTLRLSISHAGLFCFYMNLLYFVCFISLHVIGHLEAPWAALYQSLCP